MDLTINGTSLSSLGVIVETQTQFTKPRRRVQRSYVDKADGSMSEFLGYDGYTLEYKITPTESEHFNELYVLLDGNVILEASDDPGNFWYASVEDEIKYEAIALWKTTIISFYIYDPYRYVKTEAVQTIASSPATVVNSGTAIAYPLLKITGMGPVELSLNGIGFNYVFLPGDTEVYIDCGSFDYEKSMVIQDAYVVGPVELRNRRLTLPNNKFPYLSPGNNTLEFISGSITSVEVTKRSRFL